jgi:hypothetical protein
MHLVSDKSLERPGYIYDSHGFGWPVKSLPFINARHIDGPLLFFRDGQMHWLTLWERIQYHLGLTDALMLERKYRPDLCAGDYPGPFPDQENA